MSDTVTRMDNIKSDILVRLILKTWTESFWFPYSVEMTLCLKNLLIYLASIMAPLGDAHDACLSAGWVNVSTTTAYLGYAESGVGWCHRQRDTKRLPLQFSN